jgi:hypothetical protein
MQPEPSRPVRLLRVLAAAPDGMTTPQLIVALAENITDHQYALTCYGTILRRLAASGQVRRAGETTGGWQKRRSIIWQITDTGRLRLAGADADETTRLASLERLAAEYPGRYAELLAEEMGEK